MPLCAQTIEMKQKTEFTFPVKYNINILPPGIIDLLIAIPSLPTGRREDIFCHVNARGSWGTNILLKQMKEMERGKKIIGSEMSIAQMLTLGINLICMQHISFGVENN